MNRRKMRKLAKGAVVTTWLLAACNAAILVVPMALNREKRALNETEIKAAKRLFGDKIDYTQITLHKGRAGVIDPPNSDPIAAALENDIYFSQTSLTETELDLQNIDMQLEVHELTHTYQYQNDAEAESKGMMSTWINGTYADVYKNIWEAGEYSRCNKEQQARVVEKAFTHLQLFDANLAALADTSEKKTKSREADEENLVVAYADLEFDNEYINGALPFPAMKEVRQKMDSIQSQFKFNHHVEEKVAQAKKECNDYRTPKT